MANPKRGRQSRGSNSNTLRIIGGKLRGRLIAFPDSPDLRPTSDRIRETVFNWLQVEIPDANCLDLFGGSGAMGFEAASRGAKSVTIIDNEPLVVDGLRKSLTALSLDHRVTIIDRSALDFIKINRAPYRIIFLDPPFSAGYYQQILDELNQAEWLAASSKIYIECPKGFNLTKYVPEQWELLREKSAGQVDFRLYEIKTA